MSFPHITPEFLDWQRRNKGKWPEESTAEYAEAKSRVGAAPRFSEIHKFETRIAWIVVAFCAIVGIWIAL
jgi:hypothetical protein